MSELPQTSPESKILPPEAFGSAEATPAERTDLAERTESFGAWAKAAAQVADPASLAASQVSSLYDWSPRLLSRRERQALRM